MRSEAMEATSRSRSTDGEGTNLRRAWPRARGGLRRRCDWGGWRRFGSPRSLPLVFVEESWPQGRGSKKRTQIHSEAGISQPADQQYPEPIPNVELSQGPRTNDAPAVRIWAMTTQPGGARKGRVPPASGVHPARAKSPIWTARMISIDPRMIWFWTAWIRY